MAARDTSRPICCREFYWDQQRHRNRPIRTFIAFDWLALRTNGAAVFFSAHNLYAYSHAMYDAPLPASAGMNNLLIYGRLGVPPERWFARKIPGNTRLEGPYYSLATTHLIVLAGKLSGPGFPMLRFIDTKDVHRIVRWVLRKGREGKVCCVTAATSNAIRIARAAWDMGASLKGTKFIMIGEPFTETERELLERVGGSGTTCYAYGGGVNVVGGARIQGHR